MIASCRPLEDELLQCSKEEGVTLGSSVENPWSGLENESQEDWSETQSEEERSAGMMPARTWGVHAVEMKE